MRVCRFIIIFESMIASTRLRQDRDLFQWNMEYINGKQIPRESSNFFTTYKYNLEASRYISLLQYACLPCCRQITTSITHCYIDGWQHKIANSHSGSCDLCRKITLTLHLINVPRRRDYYIMGNYIILSLVSFQIGCHGSQTWVRHCKSEMECYAAMSIYSLNFLSVGSLFHM